MLKIRLQRVGRKHEPTFRVVLTDSKNSTKSGKYLEVLGSFDPRKTTEVFQGERIKEWMGKGAKLSDTLHNLLVTHKIIEGKKLNVLPKKSPIKKETSNDEQVTKTVEVSAPKEEIPKDPESDRKASDGASATTDNLQPTTGVEGTQEPAADPSQLETQIDGAGEKAQESAHVDSKSDGQALEGTGTPA